MKLIEIAAFYFLSDAGVLESILSAENIPYFLNNQDSTFIVPGSGGTLWVRENDKERAIRIIKEAGFEKYLIEA